MHVSESSGDITATLRSSSSEQERRFHQQSETRVVKVLPVSQLAPSPSHGLASSPAPFLPLRQSARARQLGDGRALRRPWLEKLLPSLGWMKAYKWRESLKADAVAGVTVGTMLIPQVACFLNLLQRAQLCLPHVCLAVSRKFLLNSTYRSNVLVSFRTALCVV